MMKFFEPSRWNSIKLFTLVLSRLPFYGYDLQDEDKMEPKSENEPMIPEGPLVPISRSSECEHDSPRSQKAMPKSIQSHEVGAVDIFLKNICFNEIEMESLLQTLESSTKTLKNIRLESFQVARNETKRGAIIDFILKIGNVLKKCKNLESVVMFCDSENMEAEDLFTTKPEEYNNLLKLLVERNPNLMDLSILIPLKKTQFEEMFQTAQSFLFSKRLTKFYGLTSSREESSHHHHFIEQKLLALKLEKEMNNASNL
eukprot:CAMPEP_0114985800 /NCGR_PEP_ID=MMETSP0216-20121206/8073_1 /TAXON_ID=223996 /ORGANISM="Protocruzia adherens, Strain Boccale" /LENGTH=256 /DNA_ID=CAMNT_0002348167 /DNA_START=25 /DNA_END=795 /DNA_ORIENTATION=+